MPLEQWTNHWATLAIYTYVIYTYINIYIPIYIYVMYVYLYYPNCLINYG